MIFLRWRTGVIFSNRALTTLFLVLSLVACRGAQVVKGTSANACLLTKPQWSQPPVDSAVLDPPTYSDYFVNDDHSIWASASWSTQKEFGLNVAEEWIKVGWFRPAGTELVIMGKRLDGNAPPLEAETGCCYPTRFQASGLYFPTEGCWEVTAKAADKRLSFVVWVEP